MLIVVLIVLLLSVQSSAQNTLQLDVPAEIQMSTLESPQFTFTVTGTTITSTLYLFAMPCVGRFDLFLNKGAPASKDAKLGQITWKDGKDTTFSFLSVPPTQALDTVFYVQVKAYDQAVNSTLFGSARVVFTLDKDFVSKFVNPIAVSTLQGEVIDDKKTLKVTFQKATPSPGATDEYEVYTKTGQIGDAVKEPFNGCSLPTLMDRVLSPNLTELDGNKFTYQVNNTFRKDSDPPFSTAVRLCRKPSAGYTWCSAYQLLSVCNGAACKQTARTAAASLTPSLLFVGAAASLVAVTQKLHFT
jgi:hypothetical protein